MKEIESELRGQGERIGLARRKVYNYKGFEEPLMSRFVEGFYRDGKVELLSPVPPGMEGPVIVTFVSGAAPVELAERDIDQQQAADLRSRLAAFAEDWQRPEMDAYDAL